MKLLIDGDVLLYIALATIDKDSHDPFTAAQIRYLEIYTDIRECCFVENLEDVYLFISGSNNFRKLEYPVYKSNRKAKPDGLEELKGSVISGYHNVIVAEGYEADDALLIMAADLDEVGDDWVIATVDKDLRTHPGRFFDVRTLQHKVVSPGEAYTFMIQQFVMGDRVDGIQGIRGWGPKKTERLIHDGNTIWDNLQYAKEIWEVNYVEADYKEKFNETANLAFIRRSTRDLKPLDFWRMSEAEFRETLRLRVPSASEVGR